MYSDILFVEVNWLDIFFKNQFDEMEAKLRESIDVGFNKVEQVFTNRPVDSDSDENIYESFFNRTSSRSFFLSYSSLLFNSHFWALNVRAKRLRHCKVEGLFTHGLVLWIGFSRAAFPLLPSKLSSTKSFFGESRWNARYVTTAAWLQGLTSFCDRREVAFFPDIPKINYLFLKSFVNVVRI